MDEENLLDLYDHIRSGLEMDSSMNTFPKLDCPHLLWGPQAPFEPAVSGTKIDVPGHGAHYITFDLAPVGQILAVGVTTFQAGEIHRPDWVVPRI